MPRRPPLIATSLLGLVLTASPSTARQPAPDPPGMVIPTTSPASRPAPRGLTEVMPLAPGPLVRRFLPEDKQAAPSPEYFTSEERAANELRAGQYRRALYTLGSADGDSERAALTRARAHAALGEYDRALSALSPKSLDPLPAVRLERARILAATGQETAALALLQELITADPDALIPHLELGHLLERSGQTDAARDCFAYFVRPERNHLEIWQGQQEKAYKSADEIVAVGTALDRWASLTSAYQDNADLNGVLLNLFVRVYDVVDRGHLPARLAAAEYLLQRDDPEQAAAELEEILKVNPRHPRAWELAGLIALDRFDFAGVDRAVARLRNLDPVSVRADLLEARNHLAQRQPDRAEPILRAVLSRRPRELEAIGMLAGVLALRLDDAGASALLAAADAFAPKSAVALFELAEQLSALRQYPRAADAYLRAIERAPWWTQPRNNLGLLYTQSGDEDRALETLEAARRIDPFNVRSSNYVKLLERLARMSVARGPHFEVRTDPDEDPFLGPLMLEYLESIYPELTALFDHQPPAPSLIQVYPTHAQFSVRTTGSPWIGTVGASTGRVIAMVAPRDGSRTMGSYNWAQVLRHEYTHTITLSKTENRIPHWMTEGLAVYAEQSPLRWEWVPMLYAAVTRNELFDMENITWGFVRPKKPSDRQLAYAQSFWMCRYLVDTHGRPAMLRLLDRYRQGATQSAAFLEVLGVSESQFHAGFVAWARQQISTWGYDLASTVKYAALREEAEQLVKDKKYPEALDRWKQIAALRPVDALPHQRLAGLYLSKEINDKSKAREHLAALNAVELKDNRYAKRLARLSLDLNDLPAALTYARQATWIQPYDPDAHRLLLDLAEKTSDAPLATLQRERLTQLDRLSTRPAAPAAP